MEILVFFCLLSINFYRKEKYFIFFFLGQTVGRSPGEASPGLFRVLWRGCGQHSRHYHLGDWKFLSKSGKRLSCKLIWIFPTISVSFPGECKGGEALPQSRYGIQSSRLSLTSSELAPPPPQPQAIVDPPPPPPGPRERAGGAHYLSSRNEHPF